MNGEFNTSCEVARLYGGHTGMGYTVKVRKFCNVTCSIINNANQSLIGGALFLFTAVINDGQ